MQGHSFTISVTDDEGNTHEFNQSHYGISRKGAELSIARSFQPYAVHTTYTGKVD